ncbi:MAG: hypothetical protein LBH27_00710, partial [Endomicrobium sp.]|nr:hypothetical protein [Endomicrobium sp.]
MTKFNKIFFAVQLYVIIVSFCFVDYVFGRTVVTGNKMEINNESKTVVFTGNIKVSNDYNTIVANNIIYDENNYVILAYNGINFLSKF